MRKFLYQFMVALFAVFSLTLSACGGDDDGTSETGGESININGVSYARSEFITMEGHLGYFCVTVIETVGSTDDVLYYEFNYDDTVAPTVGYDFSTKSLTLTPLDGKGNVRYPYEYVSGTAKVTSVDVTNGLIAIDFDNLTMTYKEDTYIFDGTILVDYNFAR